MDVRTRVGGGAQGDERLALASENGRVSVLARQGHDITIGENGLGDVGADDHIGAVGRMRGDGPLIVDGSRLCIQEHGSHNQGDLPKTILRMFMSCPFRCSGNRRRGFPIVTS